MRDTSRDKKDFVKGLLSKVPWLWRFVSKRRRLRRLVNYQIINKAIMEVPPRPNPLCCGWPYTTWEGLTNLRWAGRHLGPKPQPTDLPSVQDVATKLFARDPERGFIESDKSTLVFPYFAQWFTDGFLAADDIDRRRTHSNHQIDLSQLYGLQPETTRLLRSMKGGRLLSEKGPDGAEFPPRLFAEDGNINPVFRKPRKTFDDFFDAGMQPMSVANAPNQRGKSYRLNPMAFPGHSPNAPAHFLFNELSVTGSHRNFLQHKQDWYAMGNERANSTPAFVMMNVLMLREHNRIADELMKRYGAEWDKDGKDPVGLDERVFHTTRNILTVIVLRIVLEEYINHIAPYHFKLHVDPPAFWPSLLKPMKWRWTNHMTVEFNILYRWHSTIPDTLVIDGKHVPLESTLWNIKMIEERGLAQMFNDATKQPAGRIGAKNTAEKMVTWTELPTIQMARDVDLASYNDYREMLKMPRVDSFKQISGDPSIQKALEDLYKTPDRVEYYAGMFAEDLRHKSALAPMVGTMVAMDAFSQALINPLLHQGVFKEETFSPYGWELVHQEQTLHGLLARNTPEFKGTLDVSMTRKGWTL